MIYYKYCITCANETGKIIGLTIYLHRPDILTVVEHVESTKGYTIHGLLVAEERSDKPPIETASTIILHECQATHTETDEE